MSDTTALQKFRQIALKAVGAGATTEQAIATAKRHMAKQGFNVEGLMIGA